MSNRKPLCRLSRAKGGTLVEVLVSVLLLSFGLLAMGAMQTYALAMSKTTGHRAMAAVLAAEVADMIRANPSGLAAGGYDVTSYLTDATGVTASKAAESKCDFPTCSASTLSQYDIARLKARIRQELPSGGLQVVRPVTAGVASTTEADLWLVWLEPKLFAHQSGGGSVDEAAEKEFDNCPAEARALSPVPRCFYMRVVL
jgi:type IV pilus assembly protein PilV